MSRRLGLSSKKTFFKRQTMTNWALAAFYKFFPLSLANLLLWKCSLLRVLFTGFWDLLKYFTYLNLYWCWNICSFHYTHSVEGFCLLLPCILVNCKNIIVMAFNPSINFLYLIILFCIKDSSQILFPKPRSCSKLG